MDIRLERVSRSQANKELVELSKRFHDGLPVSEVVEVLERHGFDPSPLSGIYCGRRGRVHEKVGDRTWVLLSWYRFEESGRYEVTAYLS